MQRKPEWLKVPLPEAGNYNHLKSLFKGTHTICEEAKCPNLAECWGNKSATFLILGDTCTRFCKYCNVKTGKPGKVDGKEPKKIGYIVGRLDLRYVVITSVTRDDLEDGGAKTFRETIKEIKKQSNAKVEILTPYYNQPKYIQMILDTEPEVFAHNIETVERLFPDIRPGTSFKESIRFLKSIKDFDPKQITKSGLMIGLGESMDEIIDTIKILKNAKVDILTIGQYLQPRKDLNEVKKFYTPNEFNYLKQKALEIGIKHVESGPLVRSSYHAEESYDKVMQL